MRNQKRSYQKKPWVPRVFTCGQKLDSVRIRIHTVIWKRICNISVNGTEAEVEAENGFVETKSINLIQ